MDTQDRQSQDSNEEEMELGLNGETDVMVRGDAKDREVGGPHKRCLGALAKDTSKTGTSEEKLGQPQGVVGTGAHLQAHSNIHKTSQVPHLPLGQKTCSEGQRWDRRLQP